MVTQRSFLPTSRAKLIRVLSLSFSWVPVFLFDNTMSTPYILFGFMRVKTLWMYPIQFFTYLWTHKKISKTVITGTMWQCHTQQERVTLGNWRLQLCWVNLSLSLSIDLKVNIRELFFIFLCTVIILKSLKTRMNENCICYRNQNTKDAFKFCSFSLTQLLS